MSSIVKGQVLNYPYKGSVYTETLPAGKYKLEVWGAQGGYRSDATKGGKGGYSVGTLTINEKTTVYVYVGGSGNTGKTSGGFNGGGKRSTYNGGGGGSDIRLRTDSLYSRIIVAGGGGSDGSTSKGGGYGGGTNGGACVDSSYGTGGEYYGTQTGNQGGSSYIVTSQSTGTSTDSDKKSGFGFGGNGIASNSGYGGAGGGGWYGGCGNYPDGSGDDDKGGAGGSGYIFTSSSKTNYPSGCTLKDSDFLEEAQLYAGNTSFPSTSGSTETGHEGDGYARITVIEVFKDFNLKVRVGNEIKDVKKGFVKVEGLWKPFKTVYINTGSEWKKSRIPLINAFSKATDEQIVKMVAAADAGEISLADCWKVGDERKIQLSAMEKGAVDETHAAQEATLVILNFGGKTLENGKECNAVVGLKDCLKEDGYMNSTLINTGGWKNCARRMWCNEIFKNSIPTILQPVFKSFKNLSGIGGGSSSGTEETIDTWALAAETEIFDAKHYSVGGEGTQFEYYKTRSNRVKDLDERGAMGSSWWGRSPYSSDTEYFCAVNSYGDASSNGADSRYGLAPFACI